MDIMSIVTSAGFAKAIEKVEGAIKKNIVRVEVVTKPYEFGKPILDRSVSTSNARAETPSIKIENPLDRDVRIFEISMVPNANFKTNGRLEIQINGTTYLNEKAASAFTDLAEINLPVPPEGELLKAGESIDFNIRNDDDSTSVALTVLAYLGARRT